MGVEVGQLARSISQAWSSSACWKPGLEEGPERPLEVDDPLGVGEREVGLAVDQPAHELIALVGEEEEARTAAGVAQPVRQPAPDGGERAGHKVPIVKGRERSPAVAAQEGETRSTASGRSIQGQWPARRARGAGAGRTLRVGAAEASGCRGRRRPRRPGPGSRARRGASRRRRAPGRRSGRGRGSPPRAGVPGRPERRRTRAASSRPGRQAQQQRQSPPGGRRVERAPRAPGERHSRGRSSASGSRAERDTR